MVVVPGPTIVPAGGDWLHEPGSILVEKQLVTSAHRSDTTPWRALVCSAGRLATQLQSTGGLRLGHRGKPSEHYTKQS